MQIIPVNVTPQTDEEWTVQALNIHGYIFESYCRKVIADCQGWKIVDTNYPVAFPVSPLTGKGNESNLDIRAELRTENILLTLLIECKKRNPNFIHWIFFPKQSDGSATYTPFLKRITNIIRHSPGTGWLAEISLAPGFPLQVIVTEEARETRGSYLTYRGKDEEKTKTANDSIVAAAYQVALATQSIVLDEATHSEALGNVVPSLTMAFTTQLFLPVILTNAKLFTCTYDPNDINPSTGEIPLDKATISSHPYLFYEYPLPRHLQVNPKELVTALMDGSMKVLTRMDIMIINIEEFPKFLADLAFQLSQVK